MFECVSEHFAYLPHVKRGKTCVSGLNALFQGTEVAKIVSQRNQPFSPTRPQTMFESVSEHFANLRHVKRGKTCVSGLNALFWGTEVAKMVSQRNQPFYPTRPQMMFESVSEHFANLQHVKRGKTCISSLNALFRVSKLQKYFHNEIYNSTPLHPNDVWVFWSISQTLHMSNKAKLVFWAWMHYFRVPKLRKWFCNEINHSTH